MIMNYPSSSRHWAKQEYSLVPRPHPLMRKRVWWALSWLCRISNLDSEPANEIVQHHKALTLANEIALSHKHSTYSKFKIADSTQPRKHSIVTRPFPSWEGGIRTLSQGEGGRKSFSSSTLVFWWNKLDVSHPVRTEDYIIILQYHNMSGWRKWQCTSEFELHIWQSKECAHIFLCIAVNTLQQLNY